MVVVRRGYSNRFQLEILVHIEYEITDSKSRSDVNLLTLSAADGRVFVCNWSGSEILLGLARYGLRVMSFRTFTVREG